MKIYIKIINIKWYDVFGHLLGHHQVSVSIKVLNLYTIRVADTLYNIAFVTRYLGLCTTWKAIGLRLRESSCIQLNIELKFFSSLI
jgi:hypothetical protein